MNKARIQHLLNTPRDQLSPSDKRLQTIIKRHGSVSASLSHRDTGDLVLAGFNGGRQHGIKGYATWDKEELSAYASSRQRDARGRFLPKEDGTETYHNKQAKGRE